MKNVGQGQRGFSLMEILVAFSILSISIGTLLTVFGQGLRTAAASRHYSEAAVIAESRLAEVGSLRPLESSQEQGESGHYQWEITIEPYTWPEEDLNPLDASTALTAFSIDVKVSWVQGAKAQFISIESIKLKGK